MRASWFAKWGMATLLVPALLIGPGTALASAGMKWTPVEPHNPGSAANVLNGVATLPNGHVWAVGSYSNGTAEQTLIEHWNGTCWKRFPSPNPGGPSNNNGLAAVAADSPSDAWAVGSYSDGTHNRTLIEHWNGSKWMRVPSPTPGGLAGGLSAVAVISSSDVWAVGSYFDTSVDDDEELIEHWDGTSWTTMPSPRGTAGVGELDGLAATSSSDVWAVGSYQVGARETLIEHWDGTSWTVVPSPSPGPDGFGGELRAVTAVSSTSAWAVGDDGATLIEHWNGSAWKVATSPSPPSSVLNGVTAVSSTSAWAVGDDGATLIEHWNGSAWKVVPSPNPGTGGTGDQLNAVSAVSSTSAWAAGDYTTATQSKTLALHCC
jgi:hypothetical protein